MSFHFSFDIEDQSSNTDDRRRINLSFERFGWEKTGGSAWRYPRPGLSHSDEDVFNHVIPALNYFRSLVIARGLKVTSFALKADADAVYNGKHGFGILPGSELDLSIGEESGPSKAKLSESRLRKYLKEVESAAA